MKNASREDDERVLRMLRAAWVEGLSYSEIAERFGCSRSAVAGTVGRVRREDARAHGEL